MAEQFFHIPVLKNELISSLAVKDKYTVVDCTAGLGGHISELLSRFKNLRVIAIDKDEEVIPYLVDKFKDNRNVTVINADYKDIDEILEFLDIEYVDTIYADLGFSSYQIDNKDRGFSFQDAVLDMRYSKKQKLTAFDVVNNTSYKELVKIFKEYGDEVLSTPIAKKIVYQREKSPIERTSELRSLIHSVYLKRNIRNWKIDPATKVFQAIRIVVNDEFGTISTLLDKVEKVLRPGGRFGVISFHSGEDRIVKRVLGQKVNPCTCPPDFPICVCGKKATFKWVIKTPITASKQEIKLNPRSRSAKLRVVEKI